MLSAFLRTLLMILNLLNLFTMVYIIMSWLVQFEILNVRNKLVAIIFDFLSRLIEPILHKIRMFIPRLGMIDLSAIVLFIGIFFLQQLIVNMILSNGL